MLNTRVLLFSRDVSQNVSWEINIVLRHIDVRRDRTRALYEYNPQYTLGTRSMKNNTM